MDLPRIIVNFKAYKEALGKRALQIARAAENVWKETSILVAVAPQFVDLRTIAEAVEIPVFAQHVDPVEPGARTGHITAEAVKDAGASGSLLNHSEKQMTLEDIERAVELLRRQRLISLVCASDPITGRAARDLDADAVAVEPPELIGTGISVSKAKPEIVEQSVQSVGGVVYVGAGVSTKEDVEASLRLGAYGVLLASAVAKASDPYKKLMELAEGVITAEGKR